MEPKATQLGIQKLYHYQPFDDKYAEYLKDTLVNQRVHFSDPQQFNDPWDCNPWYDTTNVSHSKYRASCVQILRQVPLPHLPLDQRDVYERWIETDSTFCKVVIEQLRLTLKCDIARWWRIYCLTPHFDSTLMWSNYADKHRGICLEFSTSETLIGDAFQVQYSEKPPTLDIITSDDSRGAFPVLITKSRAWHREDEFRIIGLDASIRTPISPW